MNGPARTAAVRPRPEARRLGRDVPGARGREGVQQYRSAKGASWRRQSFKRHDHGRLKEVRCHGRHAHKIFIIIESLYAVGAEGYKDLASLTDPGERAEVEVVVLRRCKAQLDEQFLSKVLGRQVGKALVDVHVSKLDVALKEHNNDREAQKFKNAADATQGVFSISQICFC